MRLASSRHPVWIGTPTSRRWCGGPRWPGRHPSSGGEQFHARQYLTPRRHSYPMTLVWPGIGSRAAPRTQIERHQKMQRIR
jgi:hypothetical protein